MSTDTSKTLFISDLHLGENKPELTKIFLNFLKKINLDLNSNKYKLDSLYILGDFFNHWIGSDVLEFWHQDIISALHQLSQKTTIYFLAGNRDFLVNQKTSDLFNWQLITEDTKVLEIYNTKTVILHGDTLCTKDINYQRFRKFARSSIVKSIYLSLPAKIRRKMAQKLKAQSNKTYHNNQDNLDIFDVTQDAVESLFKQTNTNIMIHGHTHKPKAHRYNFDNTDQTRYVLGDWHVDGAYYLEVTYQDNKTNFNLIKFT